MEILLTTAYTFLFLFLIRKMDFFKTEGISTRTISALFILKILAGVALWAIYTFYYTDRVTADIYKYFDDSKIIADAFKKKPLNYFKLLTGIGNNTPEFDQYYSNMHFWAKKGGGYNDSHTIIRFNALIRLFSLGYYNVHTVVICFLSLIGLTAIYKTFIPHLKDKRTELVCVVFLLPSVLFWGSGVLKEGIIIFALGLLIYYFNKLFKWEAILICLLTTFLLIFSKFYVWVAILPGLIYLLWMIKTNGQKTFLKFFIVIILFASTGLNVDKFTPIQNPLVTLSQKQLEFNVLASGKMLDANSQIIPVAGSVVSLNKLEPTLKSFLKNAPQALKNVIFRPFIWESKSPLMIMAGFENLIIIFGITICLLFIRPLRTVNWKFVLMCFSFVLIQFLIIGETTPILGAVVRYKIIALPFLLIGSLFLYDKDKMVKRFPFYSKIFI
jgi:hypothetical protein